MFKLARKFGHDEGRFEILTATNSFHGRTLAGIAATGQDKVKKGFEPMMPGFRHIPFNDLAAARDAISPATVAIMIEGVQGEGGVTPATPEYLLGLRALCDEKKLLLLMDGVQCGHYPHGKIPELSADSGRRSRRRKISARRPFDGQVARRRFSHRRVLGARAVSPICSAPGTHGTTFGGTPLACAVALKILEVIEQEKLDGQARKLGDWMKNELERLAKTYPGVVKNARGLGFMLGLELARKNSGVCRERQIRRRFNS